MILELLVIKGACGLAHWGIAHVSGAIAAHAAQTVASMTLQQIAAAAVTTSLAAGCVLWTVDRVNNIKNGINAFENGKYLKAIKEFGLFLNSTNLDIKFLPDAISDNLDKFNLNSDKAKAVTNFIRNNEVSIAKYITKLQ